MKKIFILLTACLLLASCAEFTDLKPKGMNMLSTADELELLLNIEYRNGHNTCFDMYQLPGDVFPAPSGNVANLLSLPTPSRYSILVTWDDTNVKRLAELTSSDVDYTTLCGYVGKIANPILASVGFATGDEAKKNQIKAEALCLRAWAEFLLVSKFAAAYNPASAEDTPGIVYLMEDWDISIPPEKWTVKRVYDQILADCQAAIDLNSLPEKNINQMRWSKACPYAIKALALMAMQRFDEAEAAAKESIAINGAVSDYWSAELTGTKKSFMNPTMEVTYLHRVPFACEEDLFHTYVELTFTLLRTPEMEAKLEAGHSALVRMPTGAMLFMNMPTMGMGMSMCGLPYYDVGGMGSGAYASWNTYGLKTTQQYLILAECAIRKGNYNEAMGYLDAIRSKRVDPDLYRPHTALNPTKEEAIALLKQTALGENVYSVYHFIECKRWNQLDDMKETYSRTLNGQTFTLAPDSPLWIFPFPMNARDNNPNLTPNSYVEE